MSDLPHVCCNCCRWATRRGYACCAPGNRGPGCDDREPEGKCPACAGSGITPTTAYCRCPVGDALMLEVHGEEWKP